MATTTVVESRSDTLQSTVSTVLNQLFPMPPPPANFWICTGTLQHQKKPPLGILPKARSPTFKIKWSTLKRSKRHGWGCSIISKMENAVRLVLSNFFVGRPDRCERLVSAVQYCRSTFVSQGPPDGDADLESVVGPSSLLVHILWCQCLYFLFCFCRCWRRGFFTEPCYLIWIINLWKTSVALSSRSFQSFLTGDCVFNGWLHKKIYVYVFTDWYVLIFKWIYPNHCTMYAWPNLCGFPFSHNGAFIDQAIVSVVAVVDAVRVLVRSQ